MKTLAFLTFASLAAVLSSCSSNVNVALGSGPTPYVASASPEQFEETEDRDPELANPLAADPIWFWNPENQ